MMGKSRRLKAEKKGEICDFVVGFSMTSSRKFCQKNKCPIAVFLPKYVVREECSSLGGPAWPELGYG